ncbi:flagellar assembly protein FliX [Iodidimonas muriae]|uniref:Flagellar assembly protein FliX n=2 Tax=Iodidimonas muriae TaxID=261467 RepID=A0ABQ2L7V8_9PROT|nr:flagellar assembly protein FliX [Kordiimonadales bacterium JCM 17843]GGO06286.1 flagellar assembly protein FliX [Iodidimonas muriae]
MVMRIYGSGKTDQTKSARKSSKASGDGATFAQSIEQSSSSSAATGTARAAQSAPVTAVESLLSLQEAPDAAGAQSKGLARARDMLDILEEVRRGLLLGAIPQGKLRQLAQATRQQREGLEDPALMSILDDIELRAEVELAKLEQ